MSSETYSGTDEEGRTPFWQTLNTNDVKRLSWAQEIEDTISVVDEPIQEFLSVFVPGLGPSEQPSNDVLKDKFKAVDTKGEEVANHPKLVRRFMHVAWSLTPQSFVIDGRAEEPRERLRR